MHRMLAFSPFPEDGTSWARAFGVYPKIRRKMSFQFIQVQNLAPAGQRINWQHLQDIDSLFLQRAFMNEQVQLAELCHMHGIPIITDYDDDLFSVPSDNPTHSTYSQPWVHRNIERICQLSSCVTASTDTLGQVLKKFTPHVRTIPNAIDLDLLRPLPQELPRNKILLWRGSHCHVRDLIMFQEAILHAYEKFPDYTFMFVGYNPWWITEKMNQERVRILPFDGSYVNYMRNMAKIRAAIQIVPLADISFNRSKSNIAFLEGSFAGSALLTPDWDDWAATPGVKYNGVTDFESKLFDLMSAPVEQTAKIAQDGFDWVERFRNLNLVNDLRVDVLRKYCRA